MSLDYEHEPVTVDGERAVVVGATSGIGRAIALGFAAEGADVVATSRSQERVERTAAEIRERGAETTEVTHLHRGRTPVRDHPGADDGFTAATFEE